MVLTLFFFFFVLFFFCFFFFFCAAITWRCILNKNHIPFDKSHFKRNIVLNWVASLSDSPKILQLSQKLGKIKLCHLDVWLYCAALAFNTSPLNPGVNGYTLFSEMWNVKQGGWGDRQHSHYRPSEKYQLNWYSPTTNYSNWICLIRKRAMSIWRDTLWQWHLYWRDVALWRWQWLSRLLGWTELWYAISFLVICLKCIIMLFKCTCGCLWESRWLFLLNIPA